MISIRTTPNRGGEVKVGTFGEVKFCGCTIPATVFLVAVGDDAGVTHMTADEADGLASALMDAATHRRKIQAEKRAEIAGEIMDRIKNDEIID